MSSQSLWILSVLCFILSLSSSSVSALNNGLAIKPQMGFNTWNKFACSINETLIRSIADALVSTGLAKIGYNYLNLDDCWALNRDSEGRVQPDPQAFPSGMFNLASYVHSLNLSFGVYSDAGSKTCAGRPGSLGYEVLDALTYAAWGVDYLKYDNCYNENIDPKVRYPLMRDALNATGRPILFSLCEWGVEDPATWAPDVGNSWRTTNDIKDNWDSFLNNLDLNDKWWNFSGPGHWNDPDILEVGNGNMTVNEDIAHFSLWALIKAPLLIGNDITNMDKTTYEILTNTEVIALNQDPLGVQGHKVAEASTGLQVWAGPLADGSVGVVLFNRNTSPGNITANWSDIGLKAGNADVRDLWQHKDLGTFTNSFSTVVPGHASVTLKIAPSSTISKQNQDEQHHPLKRIIKKGSKLAHNL